LDEPLLMLTLFFFLDLAVFKFGFFFLSFVLYGLFLFVKDALELRDLFNVLSFDDRGLQN
jgi:hypothetical protein